MIDYNQQDTEEIPLLKAGQGRSDIQIGVFAWSLLCLTLFLLGLITWISL